MLNRSISSGTSNEPVVPPSFGMRISHVAAIHREICDKRASAPSFTQRAERCSDTSEFLALCREMDAEHDTALSLASDITSKLHHGLTEISQHWKRVHLLRAIECSATITTKH